MQTAIPHSKPSIGEEEIEAVAACLRSGMLIGGPRVKALEENMSRVAGYHGGVGVSSATQGMNVFLQAALSHRNTRVGIPSYVCRSVYDAVAMAGCTPVILDIDYAYLSLDLQCVREANVNAVIVPHMFGIR